MFLLICAVDKAIEKMEVERRITNDTEVLELLWVNGENGKKEELKENPFIGGSLSRMFQNKEENILFAKIKGREKINKILSDIKTIENDSDKVHTMVVPVLA